MQIIVDPALFETIARIVLISETVLVVVLMISWLYGAKRMDFKVHHRGVYPVVLLHAITVGLWMIPISLERFPIMIADPVSNWYQILHDMLGMIGVGLGIIMALVFGPRKEMPLKLLKKTRPVMFLTIFVWVVSFILGVYWFLLGHVLI